jgi:GLPGLI family protein
MSKSVLSCISILFLTSFVSLFGQKKAIITYEETYHVTIPEEVKARGFKMPDKIENGLILTVDGDKSSYKPAPPVIDPNMDESARRMNSMMRRFGGGGTEEVYTDLDAGIQLTKASIFGKEVTVKEDPERFKWKVIASEQRDILGYACMKAELMDTSSIKTYVWFTPQIKIYAGPKGLGGLPGLILASTVGEDKVVLARTIDLDQTEVTITALEDKKTITRDEYTKTLKEKTEEMRKMWGGGQRGPR